MMNMHYILEGTKVVEEPDLMKWAVWMEDFSRRRVAYTERGPIHVSTVFLGLDHSFMNDGPPIVFETMIFGGPLDQEYQTRCAYYEDALIMHEEAEHVAFQPWWSWPIWYTKKMIRDLKTRLWWRSMRAKMKRGEM